MNIKAAYLREKAAWYVTHFIGTAYLWKGDDPMAGFDCSGLMMEVLQAVGLEVPGSDKSADGLWQKYKTYQVEQGYPGCLVFWFGGYADKPNVASHIEMMIDSDLSIGNSGGGSKTLTREDAIWMNAYVKMRPLVHRGGYKIVDPFLSLGD